MLVRKFILSLSAIALLIGGGCSDSTSPSPDRSETVQPDSPPVPAKTFADVQGEVIELFPDENRAKIKHAEIPDYMPAMTMSMNVLDAQELKGLAPGDQITFRLNVTDDGHWIDQVTRRVPDAKELTGPDPNNPFPAEKGWRRVREVEPLDIGELMPNYRFTNELGQAVALEDLKGSAYAFTFIFTRCPIPDFCPRMSTQFMTVQRTLESMPDAPKNWRLFSITMDPAFDTPEVLKGYASRYRYDPAHWNFLTGPLIDITAIGEQFGLEFYNPDGTINHNLRTVVVDRNGIIQKIIWGNTWKPEELVTALVEAAKAEPANPTE